MFADTLTIVNELISGTFFMCAVYGRLGHVAAPQPETPAALSPSVGCGSPDGHHHLRTGTMRGLTSCFKTHDNCKLMGFLCLNESRDPICSKSGSQLKCEMILKNSSELCFQTFIVY